RFRVVQVKNVDGVQAEVGAAPVDLVDEEVGLHGMHATGEVFPLQKFGQGSRREEAGLGGHHDLVALAVAGGEELRQSRANRPFRALMPVVDGRVQEVDAAANGRDHSVTICYVGGVVGVTQVGSEAKARDLQAVELSIKSTATRSGSPSSEARRSFRRGKGMIHPTIVAE